MDIKCPYCGHKEDVVVDIEMCMDDSQHEWECDNCSKHYIYRAYITYFLEAEEAPCLNGEPHKYEKPQGYPEEFFEGRLRCEWCGDEKVDKAINQAAIARYFDRLSKECKEG